jgi:hypothetical protein
LPFDAWNGLYDSEDYMRVKHYRAERILLYRLSVTCRFRSKLKGSLL